MVWTVAAVHGYSHLGMLLLPPLFLGLEAEFATGLFALGLLITGFNIVTAATQYPLGFLVDRFGAGTCPNWGLARSTLAVAATAAAPGFRAFAGAYLVCGMASSVYHPADFRILHAAVRPDRRASAFAIHLTMGSVGFALAPALLTPVASGLGWRVALAGVVAIGLALMALLRPLGIGAPAVEAAASRGPSAPVWRSRTVWLPLLVFTFLFFVSGGIQSFSVLAGQSASGYRLDILSAALSLYLLAGGAGTLAGGWILRRLREGERVVFMAGIAAASIAWSLVWLGGGSVTGYVLALMLVGAATGMVLPARDLLVAAAATPQTQGRIYGFVTTGINLGQLIAPLVFGWPISGGRTAACFAIILSTLLACIFAARAGGSWRAVNHEEPTGPSSRPSPTTTSTGSTSASGGSSTSSGSRAPGPPPAR